MTSEIWGQEEKNTLRVDLNMTQWRQLFVVVPVTLQVSALLNFTDWNFSMNLDLDVEEILALKAEFVFHWEAQFKVVLYSESS